MKKLTFLFISVCIVTSTLYGCNLESNSPDNQLVGLAELVDYFCSVDIFCQDLEFQEDRSLLFRYTGDEGRYAVIAPGKLKISTNIDSFVFDYSLEGETLILSLDGNSQRYNFVAETQNESIYTELVEEDPARQTQIEDEPTATQESMEITFTHMYTLDALETLDKNAHYRLELTNGLGSAEMVRQKPIIGDLEFSDNGKYLYVAAGDAGMMTWDMASRSVVADLDGRFITIEVAPNGEYIVVDTSHCLLEVFKTPELISLANISEEGCTTLFDIHPNKNITVASGVDRDVLFFNLPNGVVIGALSILNTSIPNCSLAIFSADGNELICLTGDQEIDVWDYVSKEKITSHPIEQQIHFSSMSVSPNEEIIALGQSELGGVVLYNFGSDESYEFFNNSSISIEKTAFSGDGRLVAGSDSKSVFIWDVDSGELVFEISQDNDYIGDIAFIPGTRQLAVAYPTWIEIWGEE